MNKLEFEYGQGPWSVCQDSLNRSEDITVTVFYPWSLERGDAITNDLRATSVHASWAKICNTPPLILGQLVTSPKSTVKYFAVYQFSVTLILPVFSEAFENSVELSTSYYLLSLLHT